MSSKQERFRIAVLDDYQDVALSLADWSMLGARATVTVFNDQLADSDAVVARLQPFDFIAESTSLRGGGWQLSVGDDMAGRTLGVLDLGNVGGAVARIGTAFGMKVIAWSQNLTTGRAAEVGATFVSRDELFQEADVVTIHLVLSGRTRGLVGAT